MHPSAATGVSEHGLVRLDGLAVTYGAFHALHPLDLTIEHGDFLAILGPSGCGKTSLLRALGGFQRPSSGRIFIDGQDLTAVGPEKRPTNTVFQGYGLFPHLNVRQNIGYGLRIAGRDRADIAQRVEHIAGLVRMQSFLDRPIDKLSGGQRQRVALARALVMRPKVLLLDEPLAALDLKLRQTMQEELRRIHREIGGTFVFVTHDQAEALSLATRIAVMNEGHLVQIGSPEDIYQRPRSRFVATFLGEANVLEAARRSNRVTLDAGGSFESKGQDGDLSIAVRPELIRIAPPAGTADITLQGRLLERIYLGSHLRYALALSDGSQLVVAADAADQRNPHVPGQELTVGWTHDAQVLLDS
ncbi:ABC transporter ATP-binding protein [Nordella sp. HKS 07]|uniref:ABC transporter ATP-binding protein n=1 Tax=Nordella sp. HKS 07 TaxID=2712222 RepID=UPI0013E12320|nr:ABC transporter ATP-binding protein [Nordella sp. HKS 07]QIG46965.1 ABC transporter ATP-binding protein [Nordella sp. HKS 07]